MKIGNRYYFDFNSTAPVSNNVKNWLSQGNYPQGNPTSTHATGKNALKEIDRVRNFLYAAFELSENQYHLFFHSGASEGITSLLNSFVKKPIFYFFYLSTDHSCVVTSAQKMQESGHCTYPIPVDKNGYFDEEELIKHIKSCPSPVLLNATWVNNETGVIVPLEKLVSIKEETGCTIHIDSVQSIGKVPHWNQLSDKLDAYTFSGHKFGALKGCGFSFIAKTFPFSPLIPPNAARPFRGGTENLFGIISLKLALEELQEQYSFKKQALAKNLLEQKLTPLLKDAGEIIAPKSLRNGNTIQVILHKTQAQVSTLAFSTASIDVGSGSACTSGSLSPSHVLTAMGYSNSLAKNALRFSFSPFFKESEVEEYYQAIAPILARLCNK